MDGVGLSVDLSMDFFFGSITTVEVPDLKEQSLVQFLSHPFWIRFLFLSSTIPEFFSAFKVLLF
jgi:hypothetical protein